MEFIVYEQKEAVGVITISREKALNALNSQVLDELNSALDAVDLNTVRCLVITGAGDKSFVAGADIGEMSTLTKAEGEAFGKKGNDVFLKIEKFPIPVIAAINGFALGGGCEISVVLALTLVFIVLVLTNDLHQQAFIFNENFANWDTDYTHGWLFYVVTAWQYIFYIAAVIILLIKCRVTSSKKNAWIILIPFSIGIVLNVLLLTGTMPKINGTNIFEFPETLIFTAAIVLECCICLGLIPTNTKYKDLFNSFTITAQITDKKGTPIFSSNSAVPLTQEQFVLESGSRIGEHTILHKMVIPGGYGFWQEDMFELDRLNNELAEAKEGLSEEVELTRLRNELKEKQAKIEQRTLMYDTIAKHTQKQSQAISSLAIQARKSTDIKVKEENRRRITLLGAYIKRYANLMLMSEESDVIAIGELGLSFSEVLRYLNYCGIPGELINNADGTIPSNVALAIFEAFENLLEDNYSTLKGVFINISKKEKVICKLSFENLTKALSNERVTSLQDVGVKYETTSEDEVTYISLIIQNGREGL